MVSYSCSTVTMTLTCNVCEIYATIGLKKLILSEPNLTEGNPIPLQFWQSWSTKITAKDRSTDIMTYYGAGGGTSGLHLDSSIASKSTCNCSTIHNDIQKLSGCLNII